MTPRLDIYTLQVFLTVIEKGSIAAAAELEHIAPSALSKRLSSLEQTLNSPLLIRHARGVEPTDAGRALARGARRLLHQAEDLADELQDYSQGIRGHVRIAANLSSISQFLPAELQKFLRLYPKVQIDLEEMISANVTRAVSENKVDVGIFTEAEELYGLVIYPYHRDRMVLITSEDHPLATHDSVGFLETLCYEHIGMHRGSAANFLFEREARAAGRTLKFRFQVTSYDAMVPMVAAGLGVGILPAKSLELYSCAGLKAVPLSDNWAKRQLKLCARPGEYLSTAARLLLEHLVANTDRGH